MSEQPSADDASVAQTPGSAEPAEGGMPVSDGGSGGGREVGVRAAVERGPAELSDEGEPVPDLPHPSLEPEPEGRSTDEL